uniref:Charged multivesicular body protein 7 n=1 Tax=Cuerna arida TaxID=1464854 RepID=A0A1B6F3N6_9HEMI
MMVTNSVSNTPVKDMGGDAKNEARLNVLYSPFRKKEVNPQDWESKMAFWKNNITQWCLDCNSTTFTESRLQAVFVRNGRPASCLRTVIEDMLRHSEIMKLQDLLNQDPSSQSWSAWAVNHLVKAPLTWSFTKLKESLITAADYSTEEEYVHLAVLKKHSEQLRGACNNKGAKQIFALDEIKSILSLNNEVNMKVTLHWMQLQGLAAVTVMGGQTVVKLEAEGGRVGPLSEADLGVYRLRQIEKGLIGTLERLEVEKQETEQEARNYLRKGMRQVAKSCLRKKRELDKCIVKRASALENVQVLLSRVKEAESDGEILESYKMGLAALKATFKDAGLSEDNVNQTMDHVQEVLEVHDEVQSALSMPMAAELEEDLEKELADILSGSPEPTTDTIQHDSFNLPEFPEPPTHSPMSSKVPTKVVQSALY